MVTFCRNLLKGKFSPCPCHGGIQGGAEVHLRSFLTSALYGSERSALPPGKNSVTYWTGGWMGPMPRLNVSENFLLSLPRLEPRSSSPWICYFSTHFWHTKNCTTWHHLAPRHIPQNSTVCIHLWQNAGSYQQRGFPERVCSSLKTEVSCFFTFPEVM